MSLRGDKILYTYKCTSVRICLQRMLKECTLLTLFWNGNSVTCNSSLIISCIQQLLDDSKRHIAPCLLHKALQNAHTKRYASFEICYKRRYSLEAFICHFLPSRLSERIVQIDLEIRKLTKYAHACT